VIFILFSFLGLYWTYIVTAVLKERSKAEKKAEQEVEKGGELLGMMNKMMKWFQEWNSAQVSPTY